MHQICGSIHNLKKFFAFTGSKYTPPVYKELYINILLIKKEIPCTTAQKKPRFRRGRWRFLSKIVDANCYFRLPWFLVFHHFSVQVFSPGLLFSAPVSHYWDYVHWRDGLSVAHGLPPAKLSAGHYSEPSVRLVVSASSFWCVNPFVWPLPDYFVPVYCQYSDSVRGPCYSLVWAHMQAGYYSGFLLQFVDYSRAVCLLVDYWKALDCIRTGHCSDLQVSAVDY